MYAACAVVFRLKQFELESFSPIFVLPGTLLGDHLFDLGRNQSALRANSVRVTLLTYQVAIPRKCQCVVFRSQTPHFGFRIKRFYPGNQTQYRHDFASLFEMSE